MKTQMPDGKGGWVDVEVDSVHQGGKVSEEKQAMALQKQFIQEAGELTENMAKYVQLHCKERGLSPEHAAFATALLCCNIRNDFPAKSGGADKFDTLAISAQDYYDEHAPKGKR